jgi:hypothetical protein
MEFAHENIQTLVHINAEPSVHELRGLLTDWNYFAKDGPRSVL